MEKILHSQLDQSIKSGNPLSQTFKSFINKNEENSSEYSSAQNSKCNTSTSAILAQQIKQIPVQLQQDADIKLLFQQLMQENQSFDKSQDSLMLKSLNYQIDVNLNQTQNQKLINIDKSITPTLNQIDIQKKDNSLDILELRNQVLQNQKSISLKDLQYVFAGRNESDQFPTEMFKTPTQGHNNEFFTFTAEEKKELILKNLMEKITIDENQLQKNEFQSMNKNQFSVQNNLKGFQKRKSAIQMQYEPVRKLDFIGQILSAGSFKQRINQKCEKQKNKDILPLEQNNSLNQMSQLEFKSVRKFDTIIQDNQLQRDGSMNVINKNIQDKENDSLLQKSASKKFLSQVSQRNSKSNERLAKSFSGMTINLNLNNKLQDKNKNRHDTVVRPSLIPNNNKEIEKTMEPMIIVQKTQLEKKQNLSLEKNKFNGQYAKSKQNNLKNLSQKRESKPKLSINPQIPQFSQLQSLSTCKSNKLNSQNHLSLAQTVQPTQRVLKASNQKQFSNIKNNHSMTRIQDSSIQLSSSKIFKTFDCMNKQQKQQLGNKFQSIFCNQNNEMNKKSQIGNVKEMNSNTSSQLQANYSSTKSLSVTRQKSQNLFTQSRTLQQSTFGSKKEEPEAAYILKIREQAEQAQKQLFKISQIQAQKKKEKLMKKNNGFYQNNQCSKDNLQAKVESKQFQNLLYNPIQRSKMDPNIIPILQNKNNPSVIRQTNKQTIQRQFQQKETIGISAQVKILKQSQDITKIKQNNFNFDELSKSKKDSPSKYQSKNKERSLINSNSQTSKFASLKSQPQIEKDQISQKQEVSNLTTSTKQNKSGNDIDQQQYLSYYNEQKNDHIEQQIDNEYITLQNQVKHLLFMDDDFQINLNQNTILKNDNKSFINQSDKSEFNSLSQLKLTQIKESFAENFKIDIIREMFSQPSKNIKNLNLDIQALQVDNNHQKSQIEKTINGSPQKLQTPYDDNHFFLIQTQERKSRKDKRSQKRANQYKSLIERTNSRSKSNETKTNEIQKVSQSIYKEIYIDQKQDSYLNNFNKSQYTSSSLHHKKNSSSIQQSIEQFSIERKNKFEKLQKSLKYLKFNLGNVIKGYKARRIIYNVKELREARLKAIVYHQLSLKNNQCYKNKILEHRQNFNFLFKKYWANNQNAIDWIKMGQQKEVKNDKKQLNQEKQQVLDEIDMNIKFMQSLQNSERKDSCKQEMMEETVVFNLQNSQSYNPESSKNGIDQYLQNVDENVKAIQIDMTDSVEDLECTVQIQQNHNNQQSYCDKMQSNNYRSDAILNQVQTDLLHFQSQNKDKKNNAQSKFENKTFRSMIPRIQGVNLRSRSQNRSKSRFSQESTRIPKINAAVQKKCVKLEKKSNHQSKKNIQNLSEQISIEIKPIVSKPNSIRNEKQQLNKKRDIYQSFDDQGFTTQDKKFKDIIKKNVKSNNKKQSVSKIQSPMKQITPQKQKLQKQEQYNKENPENKCSIQSQNQESTQSKNLQTSKSVQFFEKKQVLDEEVDELCCEALKDLSNSSLNINNSFYSQNKISQGEKLSIFPQFPPEFMKLIELNKRKKELSALDKFSKAQLKSAISELMKELDNDE